MKLALAIRIIEILKNNKCNASESKEILEYVIRRIEHKEKARRAWEK